MQYTVLDWEADQDRDPDRAARQVEQVKQRSRQCFPRFDFPQFDFSSPSTTSSTLDNCNMGRVKSRKGEEAATLRERNIQKAIRSYKQGVFSSIHQAAASQDVPYSTVYYRMKGERKPRTIAHEKEQLLSRREGNKVKKWICFMDEKGLPIRFDLVRAMVLKLLKSNKKRATAVGKHWISRFLSRHPDLASKFRSQVKKQRIMNSDPQILAATLHKFAEAIRKRDIQPHNLYNMDEKGIILGKAHRVQVIFVRGRQSPPLMTEGN